jgi:hypothetical protein
VDFLFNKYRVFFFHLLSSILARKRAKQANP